MVMRLHYSRPDKSLRHERNHSGVTRHTPNPMYPQDSSTTYHHIHPCHPSDRCEAGFVGYTGVQKKETGINNPPDIVDG